MITTESAVGLVGFYINGAWEKPQGHKTLAITNPATGAVLAEVPYASEADVDRAVRTAHEAFLKWRDVPVVDRVQVLYRFKALLEEHAVEVAAILTRENGKTAEDSKMEVRRAIQMVEVACGMPSLMMGDSLNDVAREIDCKTIRQPVGVCVGITPFNFPAMVPMWMYPFAIACGNTFVLKPSEKVPLTPTRVVELLARGRSAGGRSEPDPRRQGNGGRTVAPSLGERRVVRGLDAGGQIHLLHLGGGRETRAVAGRSEESPGGDARRRYAQDRGGHHRLGLWRRG